MVVEHPVIVKPQQRTMYLQENTFDDGQKGPLIRRKTTLISSCQIRHKTENKVCKEMYDYSDGHQCPSLKEGYIGGF